MSGDIYSSESFGLALWDAFYAFSADQEFRIIDGDLVASKLRLPDKVWNPIRQHNPG